MDDFITPKNHVNFKTKKLFNNTGNIIDGAIAYLEPNGGGPIEKHTHEHDHLFIVVKGEAKVLLNDEIVIIKENESRLIKGILPHSVWNNSVETTVMVGISVKD